MGCCVLVFDLSGGPAALPGVSDFCVSGGSGTEFVVGRTTSCEEAADAIMDVPMDHERSMGLLCFCVRQDLSRFTSLLYFRSN